MLKIPKGLKKKKKGKKSKHKDEELFDSAELAELEQYKKEQEAKKKALQEQEEAAAASGETSTAEHSEEWEKFKALTSGVDDILKKTQGDLDRIKSTSFFQKKPPGPSAPEEPVKQQQKPVPVEQKSKWIGFGESREEVEAETPTEVTAEEAAAAFAVETVEEEEESEFEDDQDDIFDTSYVDVVASGEVKLAYVPDSPEKEEEGPDPFDTSIVDKVIKTDPKEEKKKKLVSLGCAVEVLTGKLEKEAAKSIPVVPDKSHRRRPKPQDLLLGSFDEGIAVVAEPEPAPKSILDEDPVFEEETSAILSLPTIPPVTPVIEVKTEPVKPKEKEVDVDLKQLVDEFVPSLEKEEPVVVEDEVDDEFAALAAESLTKKAEKTPQTELPEDDFNLEDDPFDTSFAAQILPGKLELKLIEKAVLEETVNSKPLVDPKIQKVLNAGKNKDLELNPITKEKRDLLGGSTTDLSRIGEAPIAPASPKEFEYSDPFDTSVVERVVIPGKAELKFLENELLESKVEEDDFNPRAGERKPSRPDNLVVHKRFSVPKVVAFNVKSPSNLPDLLAVEQEDAVRVAKPLTPYYPSEETKQAADPFDTSFVSSAPGKLELHLLEKELVQKEENFEEENFEDFNPRAEVNDIISGDVPVALHTPVVPKKIGDSFEEVDPFDTSIASGLLPGKAEIKQLETELVYTKEEPKAAFSSTAITEALIRKSSVSSRTLSVSDVLEQSDGDLSVKPLTPLAATSSFDDDLFDDGVDPFDTSCVGVLPGKTEIKLLESELLQH